MKSDKCDRKTTEEIETDHERRKISLFAIRETSGIFHVGDLSDGTGVSPRMCRCYQTKSDSTVTRARSINTISGAVVEYRWKRYAPCVDRHNPVGGICLLEYSLSPSRRHKDELREWSRDHFLLPARRGKQFKYSGLVKAPPDKVHFKKV